MGQGNFRPRQCEDYRGFYVEYSSIYGNDNLDDTYEAICERDSNYNDFKDNIKFAMIKKFPKFDDKLNYNKNAWRNNNEKILIDNELCQVITADNQNSLAIYIIINDDNENVNFAKRYIGNYYNALFEIVKGLVPAKSIYKPCGAWCSELIY